MIMILLHFFWKVARFVFPRLLVVAAIGLGIGWGGLFQESFRIIEGTLSSMAIWAAIDYYGWHVKRFG